MSKRKPNPRPLGVPLDGLEKALQPTTLETSRDGDALVVRHEKLVSRVEVIPPANPETEDGPISAVVTIKTPLPEELTSFVDNPNLIGAINSMATLGAVTEDGGDYFFGSRLTVYEQEDAWNIQFPLLLFTIIGGVDSLLGATRRMFTKEPPAGGESEWTEGDLDLVHSYLSRISVCNTGGLGLTAEFGLKADAVSAAAGDHETALWQLMADQPHPELGGGLFCLLELPHQIPDEVKLDRMLGELNRMEMAPHDLPPHFGAWCRGNLQNNPAYVSFLPNALHSAEGIALNASLWALNRAQWADAMLVASGAR